MGCDETAGESSLPASLQRAMQAALRNSPSALSVATPGLFGLMAAALVFDLRAGGETAGPAGTTDVASDDTLRGFPGP